MILNKLILTLILLSITMFPQALASFAEDCLDEHNAKRAKHGSVKMKLDLALSEECEKDAKEEARSKNCECEADSDPKPTHKDPNAAEGKDESVGENVCVTFGDPFCCIAKWYREIKYYEFCKRKQDDPSMSSRFTQMVWNASVTLGCGMARGNKGVKVVICRYTPQGNKEDEYRDNVFEACSSERLKITNYVVWTILLFVVLNSSLQ